MSITNWSCRHRVSIKWSRHQLLPLQPTSRDPITCSRSMSTDTFEMKVISTPSAEQSEAFVATAAIFLIFSHSPKEKNVHLRLPANWRDLWNELSISRKEDQDAADRDRLRSLRRLVSDNLEVEGRQGSHVNDDAQEPRDLSKPREDRKERSQPLNSVSQELPQLWSSKAASSSFQRMLISRKALPIWEYKDVLLQTLKKNQCVIICGETGCGKSTQVPTFLLESELSSGRECKIICTQPRRISAVSLARRVSEELGERREDIGTLKSIVGYAVRLESRSSPQTKLVYATTGVLMRMLEGSSDLDDITHIILDEVHERTIESDFLLIVLRYVSHCLQVSPPLE